MKSEKEREYYSPQQWTPQYELDSELRIVEKVKHKKRPEWNEDGTPLIRKRNGIIR